MFVNNWSITRPCSMAKSMAILAHKNVSVSVITSTVKLFVLPW